MEGETTEADDQWR